MVSLRSIFIVIIASAVVMMGVACSSNEPPNKISGAGQEGQPAVEQAAQPEAAAQQAHQADTPAVQTAEQDTLPQLPKPIEISGTVEQGDNGIVIVTNMGKYNVVGQDLSEMVGKTVNVTGALEEAGGQYTIKVESFTESE